MSMYLRCPTLIQKQVSKNILFFAVGIAFFIANVSDFTLILLVKIKNFELSYLHEKLSYTSTFG
jgi:type IV secretory pathway component VirB8